MELTLPDPVGYKSNSQRARVATERWVTNNLYCPACPSPELEPAPTGHPIADFACPQCREEYQLKSKRGPLGARILDAAYSEALRAAERNVFPHLLLMQYGAIPGSVVALFGIPGTFITPTALERRTPLRATARRAGWIGCNIIIADLPEAAKVAIISQGYPRPFGEVRQDWLKWDFLRARDISARTWLNEILKRVERLRKDEFELNDVYTFEEDLARIFPRNHFIRPKIRQQLQVLRDRGLLEFRERGLYRYLLSRRGR
jgi:type II restriction enzyme